MIIIKNLAIIIISSIILTGVCGAEELWKTKKIVISSEPIVMTKAEGPRISFMNESHIVCDHQWEKSTFILFNTSYTVVQANKYVLPTTKYGENATVEVCSKCRLLRLAEEKK